MLDKIAKEKYARENIKAAFELQALDDITPGPELWDPIGPNWSYLDAFHNRCNNADCTDTCMCQLCQPIHFAIAGAHEGDCGEKGNGRQKEADHDAVHRRIHHDCAGGAAAFVCDL